MGISVLFGQGHRKFEVWTRRCSRNVTLKMVLAGFGGLPRVREGRLVSGRVKLDAGARRLLFRLKSRQRRFRRPQCRGCSQEFGI